MSDKIHYVNFERIVNDIKMIGHIIVSHVMAYCVSLYQDTITWLTGRYHYKFMIKESLALRRQVAGGGGVVWKYVSTAPVYAKK